MRAICKPLGLHHLPLLYFTNTAVEMLRYTNTTNNEKVTCCFFLNYVRI